MSRSDAPEAIEAKAANGRIFRTFLREALPRLDEDALRIAGDLIKTTLSAAGNSFSERPRKPPEIVAYSDALADMLGAYLERLAGENRPRLTPP